VASPPTLHRFGPETSGPVEVYDVEFSGPRGDPIHAWFVSPPGVAARSTPVAVTFVGYGGGRGVSAEHLALPARSVPWFDLNENELCQYRITTREPYRAAGRSRASSDEHAGVRRQRPTCEANHADCLLSVGLMDETCPLSTVFAAYNEISAPSRSSFTRSACTTFRVRMWSGACATCARLLPEADR
jgi:cephalosporin-C deacetylase-like acetyl esterase